MGTKQRCRSSIRLRCYSTRKRARQQASNPPRELYTSVEPQKLEQFVFADFDEPVDYKDDEMPDHFLLHDLTSKAEEKPVYEKHGN